MITPVPECVAAPSGDTIPALTLRISKEEKNGCRCETSSDALIPLYDTRIIEIAKIYTVASESGRCLLEESDPFIHSVTLQGPKGEVVRLRGVFDDGATINAIDSKAFAIVKHRLSRPKESDRILRMADGSLVPSGGTWIGIIEVGGVSLEGAFEIFPSGNSWALLFGKPLLKTFDMTHRYKNDTISLEGPSGSIILSNQFGQMIDSASAALAGVSLTADIKQREAYGGNYHSPSRQVSNTIHPVKWEQNDETPSHLTDVTHTELRNTMSTRQKRRGTKMKAKVGGKDAKLPVGAAATKETVVTTPSHETALGDKSSPVREVSTVIQTVPETLCIDPIAAEPIDRFKYRATVEDVTDEGNVCSVHTVTAETTGTAQPDIISDLDRLIFTRATDAFKPERVQKILELITIGDDLTESEHEAVKTLIVEFADCFALSVSEVKAVKNGEHRLDIKPGTKFSTKVANRPFAPPQKAYFNKVLDELLEAGVIRPIAAEDVKCCSPVTISQKAHANGGLTLNELLHRLDEQCVAAGRPPAENLPLREKPPENVAEDTPKEPKFRFCMNYGELNKSTLVRPMPQGDIRSMQHNLCGKRWISKFDFASGFYACPVSQESQPYAAFYAGPRGYMTWNRMPFGFTGAPTTFHGVTARALGDLVGTLVELFTDDGGIAGDDFTEKMSTLRTVFERIRREDLSLSPQKTSLFMAEVVFAGERVGKQGIRPDLAKLTAVINWGVPQDLLNLNAFTCLTGYFRSLIKDYAVIAQPLTDLCRGIDVPRHKGKGAYRQAMRNQSLVGKWTPDLNNAFLNLKLALTSEPVLRSPRYDGTPFVVTTDGCMTGFAGVLSQWHETTLANGSTVRRLHPIGFASKRTSPAEERYKPFLLEFSALKFSLDKFGDIIYGYPIELETDCQALRDTLSNDKLNATHARWKESVLQHHIVDVRYRPGKDNKAADGISRQFTSLPKVTGDGHEWTVGEDWYSDTGLSNDMFQITTTAEHDKLRTRFAAEPMFLSILDALLELDHGKSSRDQRRARHRAKDFMIEGGKLWRVADGRTSRARARLECVTQTEMTELARVQHETGGHFMRDMVKLELTDKYCGSRVDQAIVKGISNCGRCKSFGPTHIHSLLEPITRRHPFELFVADYLSMPLGTGGFHTTALLMDTFTRFRWGFKLKTKGTAKTTIAALQSICNAFNTPECLMVDGGSHFDCGPVRDFCAKETIELKIVSPYSPWIAGLIENGNSNLLSVLCKLCAPGLGEDDYNKMWWEDLPKNWPLHFDHAVRLLNRRLLPSLQCSPAELMLGLVINTNPTPTADTVTPTDTEQIGIHQAYVQQQRLDGYAHTIEHAVRRKGTFDKRLLAKFPREVIFTPGQLVQVYRNDLTYTFKTERKLLPRWSLPRRVVSRNRNSYHLETLEGIPMSSTFSSRRLRRFLPRSGTQLAQQQEELELQLQTAIENVETEEGANNSDDVEDVLDIGDGMDGGDVESVVGDDIDGTEDGDPESETEEEVEEEDPIVGNGFVEEVEVELEGSRTRRGRRYDGGGHL